MDKQLLETVYTISFLADKIITFLTSFSSNKYFLTMFKRYFEGI